MGRNDDNNGGCRGRHGRNNDRGGRGRGRNHGRTNNNWNYDKSPEMKFYPHGSGKKGQTVTFATVKDHIVSYVQQTYRHGKDIGRSLRDLTKVDLSGDRPTHILSIQPNEDAKKIEQDGLDIIFQTTIKQFLDREQTLDDNLDKAYALIFGTYCSKAIQSRIKDHPEFESRIRDDPIELLSTIRVLMHDTVRARFPYATLYDVMIRLFYIRQQEHEHINEYVKRFKKLRDVLRSHTGTDLFHQFVEHTEEYRNADSMLKLELKSGSFDKPISLYETVININMVQ